MWVSPRGFTGRGAKRSMLTAMRDPSGKGNVMGGHRTVCRDVLRAWHFKQLRNHHRVQLLIPIHQQKRSSTSRIRAVPRRRKLCNGKPAGPRGP